MDFCFKIL